MISMTPVHKLTDADQHERLKGAATAVESAGDHMFSVQSQDKPAILQAL